LGFKYLNSLPSSQKNGLGNGGSKIQDPDLDPRVKKAPDPGSATLRLLIPKDLHKEGNTFSEGQHRFLLMIQMHVILKRQITKYTLHTLPKLGFTPWLCRMTEISASDPFTVRKTFAQVLSESFY
jgi:hypothetical protein